MLSKLIENQGLNLFNYENYLIRKQEARHAFFYSLYSLSAYLIVLNLQFNFLASFCFYFHIIAVVNVKISKNIEYTIHIFFSLNKITLEIAYNALLIYHNAIKVLHLWKYFILIF